MPLTDAVPLPPHVYDREIRKLYKKRSKLTTLRRLGRIDAAGTARLADLERKIDELESEEMAAAHARRGEEIAELDAIMVRLDQIEAELVARHTVGSSVETAPSSGTTSPAAAISPQPRLRIP